ncbi:MAG: replication restart helicase PriA [Schwartzia sp. (in: firmicutes)]
MMAEVLVNLPVKSLYRSFTYRIPAALSCLDVGWRVLVPFGGRKVEGFILALSKMSDIPTEKVKDIVSAVDDEAWFTPEMIAVARWLANFYLCAPAEMMRLFVPGKSGVRIEVAYRAKADPAAMEKDACCGRIYGYIKGKKAQTLTALRRAFPDVPQISDALEHMVRGQWLEKEYVAHRRGSAVHEEMLCLVSPADDTAVAALRRKSVQRRLFAALLETAEIPCAVLRKQGFSKSVIDGLIDSGLAEKKSRRLLRDSYRRTTEGAVTDLPLLTAAQAEALKQLHPALLARQAKVFLLHGVTGSGKTRVYMEAALTAREEGRQVIVLVPEIALTGQLVKAFQTMFASDIIVIHSRLTVAERNDAFFRIRRREAGVIIGARSALFTPASDIGLIIMDEEQDNSYKQDEAPRYHARVVASALARFHHAVLLFGSATPSLETFHLAREGKITLLSLPERVGQRALPTMEAVDMREELRHGNRRVLSAALESCICDTVGAGHQMILMLNRRGFFTFVMCRSCGYVVVCRFCGLPLVYHRDGRLACHHCDTHETVPSACPACGSTYIKFFGSGTEKLERELQERMPDVRVARFDRDTTRQKFAHDEILEAFRQGKYDILLGTQMVAKGHDIPNVTAVGILSADAVLNMPDFRAAERCFSLITQASGRAGRGDVPGRVIVQCYHPEHYAVRLALAQDYQGFYEEEIAFRRALLFPPFCRLIKLTFLHEQEETARGNAEQMKEKFVAAFSGEPCRQILGPAPAVVAHFKGVYRFTLLIKTDDLTVMQDFLRQAQMERRTDVLIDIDPILL